MRRAVALAIAALLIVSAVWAATVYIPGREAKASSSTTAVATTSEPTVAAMASSPSESMLASQVTGYGSWLTQSPDFAGNSSRIDYPPQYGELVNFTLAAINADRAGAGLSPVALSTVPSGQQHADSMAYHGYFSHWDPQGYKPYMRYTLLGGTGSVEENVALSYCATQSGAQASCSLATVENAINGSEWMMMNNDSACCNNGHRENILDPVHDLVSIGLAYNSSAVYLVEDFEDSYIGSESLQLSGGVVTFQGTMQQEAAGWMKSVAGAEITVYYDPTPTAIQVGELALNHSCSQYSEVSEPPSCQYEGAYDPGTQVSTVFSPCPPQDVCQQSANYTYAQTWKSNLASFDVVFSIAPLEALHGAGVYTFYLWPAERLPEPITSLSVFVAGPTG